MGFYVVCSKAKSLSICEGLELYAIKMLFRAVILSLPFRFRL